MQKNITMIISLLKKIFYKRSGQTMIMSTILIGGALMSASAVAGFMLFYQIRQAGDAAQSTASFYAADAGIEEVLYCYYRRQFTTEDIDTICDVTGATQSLGKDDANCDAGSSCKTLASYSVKLSCFIDPADKTKIDTCKPPETGVDPVKGVYLLSKGSTARTERLLDNTIITASGK